MAVLDSKPGCLTTATPDAFASRQGSGADLYLVDSAIDVDPVLLLVDY